MKVSHLHHCLGSEDTASDEIDDAIPSLLDYTNRGERDNDIDMLIDERRVQQRQAFQKASQDSFALSTARGSKGQQMSSTTNLNGNLQEGEPISTRNAGLIHRASSNLATISSQMSTQTREDDAARQRLQNMVRHKDPSHWSCL